MSLSSLAYNLKRMLKELGGCWSGKGIMVVEAKPWIVLIRFSVHRTREPVASPRFSPHAAYANGIPNCVSRPGTPPSWVFGPVWTTLYVLMAISAWLIWRNYGWDGGRSALLLFFGQLALNAAWSGIFFGARLPGVAFAEIVILWLAILFNVLVFIGCCRRPLFFFCPIFCGSLTQVT